LHFILFAPKDEHGRVKILPKPKAPADPEPTLASRYLWPSWFAGKQHAKLEDQGAKAKAAAMAEVARLVAMSKNRRGG